MIEFKKKKIVLIFDIGDVNVVLLMMLFDVDGYWKFDEVGFLGEIFDEDSFDDNSKDIKSYLGFELREVEDRICES